MKNANKKSKKKETVANFRILKSTFKKVIKQNCSARIKGNYSIISGIKFEYLYPTLSLISTDGSRLLVNEIIVHDGSGECEAVFNGDILEKITFIKDMLIGGKFVDLLEFEMSPEKLIIKDVANQITYCIPKVNGDFPNWKNLIPKVNEKESDYTVLGVNIRFMEELKKMTVNCKHNILKLAVKNNSPTSVIIAETKDENLSVKSKTLIMPIQLRD